MLSISRTNSAFNEPIVVAIFPLGRLVLVFRVVTPYMHKRTHFIHYCGCMRVLKIAKGLNKRKGGTSLPKSLNCEDNSVIYIYIFLYACLYLFFVSTFFLSPFIYN